MNITPHLKVKDQRIVNYKNVTLFLSTDKLDNILSYLLNQNKNLIVVPSSISICYIQVIAVFTKLIFLYAIVHISLSLLVRCSYWTIQYNNCIIINNNICIKLVTIIITCRYLWKKRSNIAVKFIFYYNWWR